MTNKNDIQMVLCKACDSFKGKIDKLKYQDYVLSILFMKYLSDIYKEKEYIEKYNVNLDMIKHSMSEERFILDENSTFDYLYKNRNDSDIDQKINSAFSNIEKYNSGKFINVFCKIDFSDIKEKNTILCSLLEDFYNLDLRPSKLDSPNTIAVAYEYMISKFALDNSKICMEFFTPIQISKLIARIVNLQENEKIYDPTCGTGSLLLKSYNQVTNGKASIYGQELNPRIWALCKMNMFLHGLDDATIWQGDTLSNPQNIENDNLMKFQVIVANPPYSLAKWDSGFLSDSKEKMSADMDIWRRFDYGLPPSFKGDYAFILHMLSSLDDTTGRMAVVLPHGALFRGANEAKIRRQLIELNLLDAVIGLPANLLYGTSIPVCILIFKKNRNRNDILFIDASADGNFQKDKIQNILRDIDVDKIVKSYRERENIAKYAYVASKDEIKNNDYNLNIPLYVDTFEENLIDIEDIRQNISILESELINVQNQMKKYISELEL